jgi:hypothetical protein
MKSSTKNEARIVTDGFYLFAHQPTYLLTLILPRLLLLRPLTSETIEIFRSHRIPGGKIRHDTSNIVYDLADDAMLLNDLYLTKDFGIAVALDSDLAKFEFAPSLMQTKFSQTFQFKTFDGYAFEPECYFKKS